MLHPKFVGILTGGADDEDDFTERRMFIKLLVTKMQLVVFSPGDFAIEEGDAGHEVFFLGQGTVAVIAGGTQVATLTDGACFGEIALLVPGALRTASIVALAFCETHVLPRSDFAACLSGFPEMHSRIRAIAERRVQELKQLSSAKKKTSRATSAAVSTLASAPAADGPAAAAAPPPRGAELLRRSSNFLSRKLSIGGAPRVQPGDEPLEAGAPPRRQRRGSDPGLTSGAAAAATLAREGSAFAAVARAASAAALKDGASSGENSLAASRDAAPSAARSSSTATSSETSPSAEEPPAEAPPAAAPSAAELPLPPATAAGAPAAAAARQRRAAAARAPVAARRRRAPRRVRRDAGLPVPPFLWLLRTCMCHRLCCEWL